MAKDDDGGAPDLLANFGDEGSEARGGEVFFEEQGMVEELDRMDAEAKAKRAKAKSEAEREQEEEDEAAHPRAKKKPAEKKPEAKDDESDKDDDQAEDDKPEKPSKEEDEDDGEKPEPEKPAAAKKPDEEKPEEEPASKQLEALQQKAKRDREKIAAERSAVATERAKLEQERTTFNAERETLQARIRGIDGVSARVKTSPRAAVELLEQLGVPKTAWATVANMAYAKSDTAPDDFKRQWGGDDGGAGTELAELRAKVAEQERWREQQEQEKATQAKHAEVERRVGLYLDQVVEALGDTTPLLKAALKNDSDLARKRLRGVAEEIYGRTKVRPSPEEVAEEAERLIRDEAAKFGLAPASTKTNPTPTRQAARTLNSDVVATTRSQRGPRGPREEDDETVAELNRLDEEARARKRARNA